MDVTIRAEELRDTEAIRAITIAAFRGKPYAGGNEQDVVDALRAAGALTLSNVAILEERVVGHIAFSPAQAGDGEARDGVAPDNKTGWYALGPVSVLPEFQGKGIGSALINQGCEALVRMNAKGCILTGNPAYYQRFGFALAPHCCPDGEPADYFMMKCFGKDAPAARFRFHSAFYPA